MDSDVFVLFGMSGLLFDAIETCGFEAGRTRRLAALPHMIRRGPLARKYPDDGCQRVLALCNQVEPLIEAATASHTRQVLAGVDNIDVGEAELFAIMAERPEFRLLTGDKRSLVALASTPELHSLYRSLSGRIICLEVAIERLIREMGAAPIARALTPLRKYNRMLSAVFSRGEETPVEDCLDGLSSYINDLVRKTGPSLLLR